MRKSYACANKSTKVMTNSGKRIKKKSGYRKSNQMLNAGVLKR